MSNKMHLQSGLVLLVRELRQLSTYEGLLEGLPTKEKNQKLIARLLQQQVDPRYAVPAHLILPNERMIEMSEGEIYPFGTPAALPSVTCIGRFESLSPTARGKGDASGLVVIFQEDFQYPPPDEVTARLEANEWEKHAGNFEY
jgi:hypothetical protein